MMKLKLLHKIFIANISVILLLATVLLSFSYLSLKAITGFATEAKNKHETYLISNLTDVLADFYTDKQSWQEFSLDPASWRFFVHDVISSTQKRLDKFILYKRKRDDTLNVRHSLKEPPPLPFFDVSAPPSRIQQSLLSSRLALFDGGKKLIVNAEISDGNFHYEPIIINGNIAGWLGLAKVDFAEQQSNTLQSRQFRQIVIMSLIGLIFSGVVSFYLARHFTSPIRNLIQGAINLSERKFDMKIQIDSNDELADLGRYFNEIGVRLSRFETTQKQWLQDIAHELRTPLTVIRGEIEAMVDGVTQANSENLLLLKIDILRLNHLINDLHELSVTDNLLLARDAEQIDLEQVCRCAINRFETKFSKKNISLISNFKRCNVKGDSSRLLQVIDNLLENCAKYTSRNGCVWFSCYVKDDRAILVIEDSAPGVDESKLDKLFDRLYRIDEHRNRTHGGAGLGMAICKNIVIAHHGDIQAKTSDKGGLKVLISLPLDKGRK